MGRQIYINIMMDARCLSETDVGEKQTLRSAQRKNNYQKIYKNNCKFKVSLSETIKSTINHFLEAFELCFSVEQSLETVSNALIGDKKKLFFR